MKLAPLLMDKARTDNVDFDTKATFKELSFHIGGYLLHSLFWANLAPPGKGGREKPSKTIAKVIDEEFGSFDRFKKLFSQTAAAPRARVGQHSRSVKRRTSPS